MRAAVTGVGIVCALGEDLSEVARRYQAGERGVAPLSDVEGSPVPAGARVEGPSLKPYLTRKKDSRLMARPSALLLPAAARALAGWGGDYRELGLYFGVGREPADAGDSNASLSAMHEGGRLDLQKMAGPGRDLYPPLLPLQSLPNMALAHISIQLGILGETATFTGGSEAGIQALREAVASICEGRCPAALAGATDSWVDAGSLRDRARMGLTDPPGEAAVVLRLEPEHTPGALFWIGRGPAGLDPSPRQSLHRAALGDCGASDALLHLILSREDTIGGEVPGTCCQVLYIPCYPGSDSGSRSLGQS